MDQLAALPVIGLGTGWAVAIVVVLIVIRGFVKGQIYAGAVVESKDREIDHLRATSSTKDKTIAEQTAQISEYMEVTRLARNTWAALNERGDG